MYRRPKFLEILLEIREEMAREADYDTDLFAELVRTDSSAGVLNEDQPPDETAKRRGGHRRTERSRRTP